MHRIPIHLTFHIDYISLLYSTFDLYVSIRFRSGLYDGFGLCIAFYQINVGFFFGTIHRIGRHDKCIFDRIGVQFAST